MLHGLLTTSFFLLSLIFSLILLILWLRIFLRYFRVSSLHPISQFVDRFTGPVITPLERLLSKPQKTLPRYDWITFAVIVVIELIKFTLLGLIAYRIFLPVFYLLLFTAADLIVQPLNLLFYALLIRIIMSWVRPDWQNPLADILSLLTNPLIRLGHKLIPDISGFDFAPYIMLVIIKVITLFISSSMPLPLI